MRRRRPFVAVAVLSCLGAGLASCSGDDGTATSSPSSTAVADTTTTSEPSSDADAASTTTTVTSTTTTTAPTTTITTTTATSATTTAAPPTSAPVDTAASTSAPPEEVEFDGTQVDALVDAFVATESLDGAGLAIVHRDHGIVHEGYWGEFDADRVSLVASSSKMVTAGVLAGLADEGLLELDAPIAEQFADEADWTTAHPAITPAQLVSNSSGLPGLAEGLAYGDYVCQYEAAGTLQECAAQIFTSPQDDGEVIPPDTEYRYGGAQWQIAGAVAELASGRSWSDLVASTYAEPCDLDTFGFTNHWTALEPGGFAYPTAFDGDVSMLPATDNPNLEGGLYTTVDDYAAVVLMHLRDGRCGDEQVLSPAVLDRLHSDRTGEVYGSDVGYAMGWFVDRATGRLTDPGAYGSVAWLDLDDDHGGFLVIEADGGTGGRLAAQLYDPVAAMFDDG